MKKCLTIAALAALVLVAVLVPSAPGAQNRVVHSATGAGHQDDVDVATGEVLNRTFSFSAVQYANGTAKGNPQIASRKFQLGNRDFVIHVALLAACLAHSAETHSRGQFGVSQTGI